MKYFLLGILLFSSSSFADSQRFVYFRPLAGTIELYREGTEGFRGSFNVEVSELDAPQQATIAAALGWLQSQLMEGETLTQVVFSPYWTGSEMGLHAAITGKNENGAERTPPAIDSKDVPSEVRAGLVGLWTDLAAVPVPTPAPAPEPTPTPEP